LTVIPSRSPGSGLSSTLLWNPSVSSILVRPALSSNCTISTTLIPMRCSRRWCRCSSGN